MHGDSGRASEPSVGESVSLFREPDAGNLPVRFDERGQETGPSQTGLRWRGESQVELSTGRLQLLRLFSTLLAMSLNDHRSKREIDSMTMSAP